MGDEACKQMKKTVRIQPEQPCFPESDGCKHQNELDWNQPEDSDKNIMQASLLVPFVIKKDESLDNRPEKEEKGDARFDRHDCREFAGVLKIERRIQPCLSGECGSDLY